MVSRGCPEVAIQGSGRPVFGLRGLAITAMVANVAMVFVWAAEFGAFDHHASTVSGTLPLVPVPSSSGLAPRVGNVYASDLQVRDCGTNRLGASIHLAHLVTCNEPHRFEVFAVFNLPRGRYPGDNTVTDLARGGCAARFKNYVGRSVNSTTLDWWVLTPVRAGWKDSRGVQCVLYTRNLRAGSLRGSRK